MAEPVGPQRPVKVSPDGVSRWTVLAACTERQGGDSTERSTHTRHTECCNTSPVRSSIFLVRHAQSVPPTPNGPNEYQRPLTETGRAQANQLADFLSDLDPSAVVSSPYLRAVQTLEPAGLQGRPAIVGSHGTFIARALIGLGCSGVSWAFQQAMPMPAIYRIEIGGPTVYVVGPGL